MPKQAKRLTRAEKVALSKVSDEFQTAYDIGLSLETLELLAAHGYVRAVLEVGVVNYRLTEDGADFVRNCSVSA